jgi:hypothetical protein
LGGLAFGKRRSIAGAGRSFGFVRNLELEQRVGVAVGQLRHVGGRSNPELVIASLSALKLC